MGGHSIGFGELRNKDLGILNSHFIWDPVYVMGVHTHCQLAATSLRQAAAP